MASFRSFVRGNGRCPLGVIIAAGIMLASLSYFTLPTYEHYTLMSLRENILELQKVVQALPENVLEAHSEDELHHRGEDVEAQRLKEQVKVLCWVMTQPSNHLKKAQHVKATWGKRCNKLIFMSSENDKELGAVDIKAGEGRNLLWGKTKAAFKYVYDYHYADYDWFFKADDDTYTIMENMRYMLSPYDPNFPIYFGSRFNKFSKQGYMSGGGGYVVSREALRLFVEIALGDRSLCKESPHGAEDAEFGKCMTNVGVMAGDSRDNLGRGRYFPFAPGTHLQGSVPAWYKDYVYYKPDTGLNCCSDTPVSFHYVSVNKMYELEYLLYHARPYGIVHNDPFPPPLPLDRKSIPKEVLEKYGLSEDAVKVEATSKTNKTANVNKPAPSKDAEKKKE